jgi:hypothetical protein
MLLVYYLCSELSRSCAGSCPVLAQPSQFLAFFPLSHPSQYFAFEILVQGRRECCEAWGSCWPAIYSVGCALWCWQLTTCMWWVRCLCGCFIQWLSSLPMLFGGQFIGLLTLVICQIWHDGLRLRYISWFIFGQWQVDIHLYLCFLWLLIQLYCIIKCLILWISVNWSWSY